MRFTQYIFPTLLSLLICCNDGPSEIGSDFFQDVNLDVVYIDTLTLKVSTVKFDSLVTSDAERFLIGFHNDPALGKISSQAFFQVTLNSTFSLDEDFTSYSRTTLSLVYDGYSYYDTSTQATLTIHELTQEMKLNENYLFNTTSFAYDPEPLGTFTFLPRPNRLDTLEIPLSDTFGKDIVRLAQKSAKEVSSSAAFMKYFRGLTIIPDMNNSGAILGFSTSPEIRVYYFDKSQTPTKEKYLVLSGGSNLKFNRIQSDRSSTPLSTLTTKPFHLSSALTNESAYIQSGTGLALRVEIPYLKSILNSSANLIISDAILEIVPVRKSGDKNMPLLSGLSIAAVNYKNDTYGVFENQASLVEDLYLGRDTHYEVNVKNFILQQLSIEESNQNALLFSLEDQRFRSSVDRLQVGDQKSDHKMKVKIYCLTVKN